MRFLFHGADLVSPDNHVTCHRFVYRIYRIRHDVQDLRNYR